MEIKKGKIYLCLDWKGRTFTTGNLYKSDIGSSLTNNHGNPLYIDDILSKFFTNKVVVHCTNQSDWDYVTDKLGHDWPNCSWDEYLVNTCISLDTDSYSQTDFYKEYGYHVVSIDKFKELFPEKEEKKEIQVKFKKGDVLQMLTMYSKYLDYKDGEEYICESDTFIESTYGREVVKLEGHEGIFSVEMFIKKEKLKKENKNVKKSSNNKSLILFFKTIKLISMLYTLVYWTGAILCSIEYGISLTIAYLFYLFILFIIVSAIYLKCKSLIK